MNETPKRRRLQGRKLLVATGLAAAVSQLSCSSDTVANLIAPPFDAGPSDRPDATADLGTDRGPDLRDTPVANLIAPPDVGTDTGPDLRDTPVANLIAPPDSGR